MSGSNDWDRDAVRAEPRVKLFMLAGPGARLIRVRGRFDDAVAAEVLALVQAQQVSLTMKLLVLDLRSLTAMTGDAVRVVVEIALELALADVPLRLVGGESVVGAALADADVRSRFELHETVDDALA